MSHEKKKKKHWAWYNPFQGPVSRRSRKVLHPESRSKISNLMNTELFYLHSLNINRYTSQVLGTNYLKMALRARKVSGAFEKRVPIQSGQPEMQYHFLRAPSLRFLPLDFLRQLIRTLACCAKTQQVSLSLKMGRYRYQIFDTGDTKAGSKKIVTIEK